MFDPSALVIVLQLKAIPLLNEEMVTEVQNVL